MNKKRVYICLLSGIICLLTGCGNPNPGENGADDSLKISISGRTDGEAEADEKNEVSAEEQLIASGSNEAAASGEYDYGDFVIPKPMRAAGSADSRAPETGEAELKERNAAYRTASKKAEKEQKSREAAAEEARKREEEKQKAEQEAAEAEEKRKAEQEAADAEERQKAEEAARRAAEEQNEKLNDGENPDVLEQMEEEDVTIVQEEESIQSVFASAIPNLTVSDDVPAELQELQLITFSWTQQLFERIAAEDTAGVDALMEDGVDAPDEAKITEVRNKMWAAARRQHLCVQLAAEADGLLYFTVYGYDDGNGEVSGGAFCISDFGSGYVYTAAPLETVLCPGCNGHCQSNGMTCPECGGTGFELY